MKSNNKPQGEVDNHFAACKFHVNFECWLNTLSNSCEA